MEHAHPTEAATADVAAASVAGADRPPAAAEVLRLQRGAGNAAVGRLLRHGLTPTPTVPRRGRLDRRMLQRQQIAALIPPTFEACGWIDAAEVKKNLDERDMRIRDLLPTFDITTDKDLRWFLKRWFDSTSCVELGVAKWHKNDSGLLDRARQQYMDAVRIILIRAEIGMGRTVADLLAQNTGSIRTDAAKALTDFGSLDRFDRMDPSRGGPAARTILRVINPAAQAFTNRPCSQNCPAAATAVQAFLRSGTLTRGTCNPMTEPAGYAIDPGPDTWGAARNWTSTWKQVQAATPKHGTFVLIEADRGPNGPQNLTQWHYFVVLNVRGNRFVVDGFLGQIETDIDGYATRLQAVTYKFTSRPVTATPVRGRP